MTETEAQTQATTGKGANVPVQERASTPFWTLRYEIDDLFDDFFRTGWSLGRRPAGAPLPRSPAAIPALDVIDKENEVKLVTDLRIG